MKKALKIISIVLGLLLLGLSWPAWQLYEEIQNARSDDPLVWEEAISALESKTLNRHAPGKAVVFIGSSSIRLWDTLEEDMSPIPVIQHGFGGAKLNAIVYYAERLVYAYQVRATQPEVPIFYIGITPSPRRWAVWPIAQSTNRLIENWSRADPNLHFIDTSAALLGSNGEPNRDNYVFDGLHLSKRGYGIWRQLIRQRLMDELGGV